MNYLKKTLHIWVICIIISSTIACGKMSMLDEIVAPRDLDKQHLSDLPVYRTEKHNIPVVLTPAVKSGTVKIVRPGGKVTEIEYDKFTRSWWSEFIDARYDDFKSRYETHFPQAAQIQHITRYKIAIVKPGHFKCKYHGGRCSGEIITSKDLIVLSLKSINHDGYIPLLEHEWLHALGYNEGKVIEILKKLY